MAEYEQMIFSPLAWSHRQCADVVVDILERDESFFAQFLPSDGETVNHHESSYYYMKLLIQIKTLIVAAIFIFNAWSIEKC